MTEKDRAVTGRPLSRTRILGIDVVRASGDDVLERVCGWLGQGRRFSIVYANAHCLNLACGDDRLRSALRGSELILNDGAGLAIAARINGTSFPENLNGSDFNVRLLQAAAEGCWSVFLLGGRDGIAALAAEKLRATVPGLAIAGVRHGYTRDAAGDADAVKRSGADVVLVALGNPAQEVWLAEQLGASGASVGVAVGAFLDFQAGRVPRSPRWMNQLGIEWLYRLAQEPRRLCRRYVVGNPLFLCRVLAERLGLLRL